MSDSMTTYLLGNAGTTNILRPYNIISAISAPQSNFDTLIDWQRIKSYDCESLQNWADNDELYDLFMELLLSLIQDEDLKSSINIVDTIYLNTTLIIRMLLGNTLDITTTNKIVEDLYDSAVFKDLVSQFPNYSREEFKILCKFLKDVAVSHVRNSNISKSVEENINDSYLLIERIKQRNNQDEQVFCYIQTLSPISEYIPKGSTIITSKEDFEYVNSAVAYETFSDKEYNVKTCNYNETCIINSILYNILDSVLEALYSTDETKTNDKIKYATLFVWSLIQKGVIKWIVPLRIFSRLKSILDAFVEEIKPST